MGHDDGTPQAGDGGARLQLISNIKMFRYLGEPTCARVSWNIRAKSGPGFVVYCLYDLTGIFLL